MRRALTVVAAAVLTVALSGCVPIFVYWNPGAQRVQGVSQASYEVGLAEFGSGMISIQIRNCARVIPVDDILGPDPIAVAPIAKVVDNRTGDTVFSNFGSTSADIVIPPGAQVVPGDPAYIRVPADPLPLRNEPYRVEFAGCSTAAGIGLPQQPRVGWILPGCTLDAFLTCSRVTGGSLDLFPS